MALSYRFIERYSMADSCFEARGESLEELLKASALALFSVMADVKKIRPSETRNIHIKETNEGRLLFSWLEELIFLKDYEEIIFSEFDIIIDEGYRLNANVKGEFIKAYEGDLGRDVKAVTMHLFEVKKLMGGKWWGRVVLDI